jgi:hypothetical protein
MARQQNIAFDMGTDVTIEMEVSDSAGDLLDLSGYTCAAAFRKHFDSTTSVSFSASGANNGVITLSLTHVQSANVTAGRYYYDVTITGNSSNLVSRVVEGICTVRPSITR